MENQMKITLKKSGIGRPKRHKAVLKGLGLTKLNKTVYRPNNPAIMGMIKKVEYLVDYQLVEGSGK
ncbi:MAG: 50S ribosomal protein L30 [bacterium]